MAISAKLVTYEEWLTMPAPGDSIEEVVRGEIRITPPPKITHALIVNELKRALDRQLDPKEVYVLDTQFGLIVRRSPLTSRVPDLAAFRKNSFVERDGYIHSAPELIVEVLSSGVAQALACELQDYESLGVPEVWIVSPVSRTIEVMLLDAGKLRTVSTQREGQLRPSQFPEAVVDVASVWPD
jgi:Uma2 family endonuclease